MVLLETDRLLLRPWRVAEAGVQRELWTERDPRVPPHRRIDAEGRPTVGEIAEAIRTNQPSSTGLLAVERRAEGDVIGYCGLIESDRGGGRGAGAGLRAAATGLGPGIRDRGLTGGPGLGEVVQPRTTLGHGLGLEQRLASGVAKLGFTETGREEADEDRGTTLFTTLRL